MLIVHALTSHFLAWLSDFVSNLCTFVSVFWFADAPSGLVRVMKWQTGNNMGVWAKVLETTGYAPEYCVCLVGCHAK